MHADEIDPQAKAAIERQERFPAAAQPVGAEARAAAHGAGDVDSEPQPARSREDRGRGGPGPAGDLDVRLYLPDDDGPFPTVVFFHGGGFVLGSIETHDWLCRHLTRDSGCAVLSVDYRLAPEHPFPAAVADAYAAVEWAAANRTRSTGPGESRSPATQRAGALAAVAALMAAERDGPEIAYQALLYPGVGVEADQPSIEEHAGIVLDEADLEWFTECYYDHEIHERNPYADPTNAGDVSGVAPPRSSPPGSTRCATAGERTPNSWFETGWPRATRTTRTRCTGS